MLKLKELAGKLENALKKNNDIHDIIIFGSCVKGKEMPRDIDVAVVSEKIEPEMVNMIEKIVGAGADVEILPMSHIMKEPLLKSLLLEGYSVKEKKYFRDILGIKPMKLYCYKLEGFKTKSDKVQFSKAIGKNIKKVKAERVGAGAVLVPMEKTGYFEEFLDAWQLKYKTKEWTVF